MIKRQFFTRWLALPILITIALVASGCGANLSGEPEIKREAEIRSIPTNPPSPTPDATATSEAADASSDSAASASDERTAEPTPQDDGDTALAASGDYDLGFEVYLRECASCHGAADGVGPSLRVMHDNAATRVEGMTGAAYVRESILEPGAYIVDGYNDVMPTDFAGKLTEEELAGLVTFVLEFDPARMGMGGDSSGGSAGDDTGSSTGATPANPDVAATSESAVGPALAAGETLTVTGELVAGTAGGDPIPAGLPVQLYAVDPHGNLAGVYQGESAADQTFTIEDVARSVGMTYFVEVQYQGVPQGTRIASIQGDEEEVSTSITLYERTTEPDTVAITWAEMLVNYAPVEDIGIEVWLDVEITNTGDMIVTTDERAENDWYVSVDIELPVGAFGIQPMQAENSQRYAVEVIDGVPVVKDTWPLRPGQVHTITIAYYLPYSNGAVIEHGFNYPVMDGMVLLPNDTVEFESPQFNATGEWRGRVTDGGANVEALGPNETIDPERDFALIKAHDLLDPIPAGERMVFELVGQPTRTLDLINPNAAAAAETDDEDNLLPLILGALGVGIIVIAGVLFWRQQRAETTLPESGARRAPAPAWQPPRADATKEELLAALAALDDAHDAGDMDDETYHERRAILTDRLVPLLDEEDED